jgi:hypothetical protein
LSDTGGKSQGETAREILGYFLRNPNAADSFDGIAQWRLLEDIARRSVAATEEGLRWLIAENYLREESVPGGKTVYSLNSNMRKEAERFVDGQDNPEASESDDEKQD